MNRPSFGLWAVTLCLALLGAVTASEPVAASDPVRHSGSALAPVAPSGPASWVALGIVTPSASAINIPASGGPVYVAVCPASVSEPPDPLTMQTVGNPTLVSSTRVSPTDFQYVYRAQFVSGGAAVAGAVATVASVGVGTTLIDGTLSFGDVPAGAAVTSSDTFTFRHNRTLVFDFGAWGWLVNGVSAPAVGGCAFSAWWSVGGSPSWGATLPAGVAGQCRMRGAAGTERCWTRAG